jgi:hypothetical protein
MALGARAVDSGTSEIDEEGDARLHGEGVGASPERGGSVKERWVPKWLAERPAPEGVDAVAFVGGSDKRFEAMVFRGKQSKSVWYRAYRTEAMRDDDVFSFFEGVRQSQAMKADRAQKRREFVTTLKVGDVLEGSWGYDQTNYDFFEVTAVLGSQMVEVRELKQGSENTGWCRDKVWPLPGQYTDRPPARKRVAPGEYVNSPVHGTLWRWSGTTKNATSYA